MAKPKLPNDFHADDVFEPDRILFIDEAVDAPPEVWEAMYRILNLHEQAHIIEVNRGQQA
jgi:MoxR-like ATPase